MEHEHFSPLRKNNAALKSLYVLRQALVIDALILIVGCVGMYLVHPYSIALIVLVACELLFAGTTGKHPIVAVLTRLFWRD